jgi:hypothetical protein
MPSDEWTSNLGDTMNKFTQGYLHASVWSLNENEIYSISDIAPATRGRMEADCQRFQQENAELLLEFRKEVGWDDPDMTFYFGSEIRPAIT